MKKFIFVLFAVLLYAWSFAQPLWLRYPAISPDGKYIAFEYKGNIWKVPVNGGNAIPLTLSPGYEFHPVWSHDGKYIAFASDAHGDFDVYIMPANGGKAKRLTYFSGNEIPWTFTPDDKAVLYSTTFQKIWTGVQFPTHWFTELYQIDTSGKNCVQILSTTAQWVHFTPDGKHFIYQDQKGVESYWRKHHRSSVTRDIWSYDLTTHQFTKLTNFPGEDRCPVVSPDGKTVYYLTEQFNNNLNVAKFPIDNPSHITQLTNFTKNPVRFLSIANDGTLCFSQDGQIYTMKDGQKPKLVHITINYAGLDPQPYYKLYTSGATEMSVSPDGKYVAFIVRGDVYVTSVESNETRQITNTPEQERSVSFSPDGKALIYASERNGSWNIYMTKIMDKNQKSFILAKHLKEIPVVATPAEEFQPKFSPDGKKVAYLENRVTLKVINLKTKKIHTVLSSKYNYSYSDGDQWFDWSPDSKWFLVKFTPYSMFLADVGLVKANKTDSIINLTQSGYQDDRPKWAMNGKMMIWLSDRMGYRSHGSWGSEYDVYAMFFSKKAYDIFRMNKEQYQNWLEQHKNKKSDTTKKSLKLDLNNLQDRIIRLTNFSGKISDMTISPDGQILYYAAPFQEGFGLWKVKLREHDTKLITKLPGYVSKLTLTDNGKYLFIFSDDQIIRLNTQTNQQKVIRYKAQKLIDYYAEKKYLFNHIWRLMKEKMYDPNMHGVDWNYYGKHYARFLPYINNNYDFAEMVSEMLGELNVSHTGCYYRPKFKDPDRTASLGLLYDLHYPGPGVKVEVIVENGPFDLVQSKLKPGDIITKIDGQTINGLQDLFKALNHKTGKITSVTFKHGLSSHTVTVVPISQYKETQLLYRRWVKTMRNMVHKLSNNQIGYVHVKAMDSKSFRQVYSDALGKEVDKKAIIIDTRFNTGGWLHEDLVNLFSGKTYFWFYPHGRFFGYDPFNQWVRPSVVIMNQSNYSDACGFPYAYKILHIGKLIGMPVPGTMTAVWWETLMDPTLYFGIPQVGVKDKTGKYIENRQLNPDVEVRNDYNKITQGQDQQIQAAVNTLLQEIKNQKHSSNK